MELRQLEYFQMASRLKNITRAAERLRVSQPNITVAIKKLEGELGIQLFDRSQKQLSLTPEGAVFLGRVEVALRNIQDAVLEVNDYKQLQKGTIKIGIPPMIMRNAAGLLSADSGAPFKIIPTKIETTPIISPMTVDFSKTNAPIPFLSICGHTLVCSVRHTSTSSYIIPYVPEKSYPFLKKTQEKG